MAYEKGNRPDSPMKRRGGRRRKKVCVFCGKENNEINYKDANKLKRYVSERGKILPRRITGNCAKHQRALTVEIKRARHLAIMPYVQDSSAYRSIVDRAPLRCAAALFIFLKRSGRRGKHSFGFITPKNVL